MDASFYAFILLLSIMNFVTTYCQSNFGSADYFYVMVQLIINDCQDRRMISWRNFFVTNIINSSVCPLIDNENYSISAREFILLFYWFTSIFVYHRGINKWKKRCNFRSIIWESRWNFDQSNKSCWSNVSSAKYPAWQYFYTPRGPERERWKHDAWQRIFDELRGVWKCDQTLCWAYDASFHCKKT